MNSASFVTSLLKIFFLLILILLIVFGGIYWFDRLGVVDYRSIVGPFERYLPAFLRRGEVVVEDPFLLERELLNKKEDVLMVKTRELENTMKTLDEKELDLKEGEAKLKEEADRIEEEKKVFSQKLREYDNYRENIRIQAKYFTSMPPKAAVERLSEMDDLLVIDILRQIDRDAQETGKPSIVPFYLSLMEPKKAATVQRKMTKVGEGE